MTYYRPRAAGMEVQWTDNKGASGSVDYLSQFHTQDYYYPAWVEADSYTLRGTCLKANNYDQSGNGSYWVNPAYDWGYADNFSPDRPSDRRSELRSGVNANHFRISDAVTFDGQARRPQIHRLCQGTDRHSGKKRLAGRNFDRSVRRIRLQHDQKEIIR